MDQHKDGNSAGFIDKNKDHDLDIKNREKECAHLEDKLTQEEREDLEFEKQ